MGIVNYYKLYDNVQEPVYSTPNSACFDLCAYLLSPATVQDYDVENNMGQNIASGSVFIEPGHRVLIPTGLIFNIPYGCSVRLYVRSGIALKFGLMLANNTGIIDSDYVEEVKIILYNSSKERITINHGDRICQGEIVESLKHGLIEIDKRPKRKTIRDGGFGSTGI
jgi:dUTP pyrophosphatase